MNKFNILLFEGGEKCMMNEMNELNEMTNKGANHMKKMKQLLKNQKGMTLIELLAVIVILAIVAAIAVPAIGGIINNSRDKAILADASNILAGAKIANVEGACKTNTDTDGNTCTKEELNSYIEGLSSEADFEVTKDATSGAWSVEYGKFGDIKGEKYKTNIASNVITEENLNKNLQK